ncbi:MAG: phospho-N-acetylmuramoyl-pentapeptide-transferase [Candidatus Marinimicrobia bacterium]|nr:phospho-N-acetylmuramoyl-pentapeptide-transferase [Candidatus Neomarinimicrobiota bacterium]
MLYYLHLLTDWYSPLRVFRYITVRALGGAGTAFVLSLLLGPPLIRLLRRFKINQQIRGADESAILESLHGKKKGTPTMGGLLIVITVTVSVLLWGIPSNLPLLLTLATMLWMAAIGFADDYLKITRRNSRGLHPRAKLLWQSVWVLLFMTALLLIPETAARTRQLMLPFLKDPVWTGMSLGAVFLFLWLVLAGATNAVNLTDGLDGLAIGCSNSVALAYLFMAYVAGHVQFAEYLQVPFVAGAGELAVFCGCLLGAGLGFLWFNCHPARVFMGDTGSFALGGAIAAVAILVKQELALLIVGGVFVLEALSAVLQIGYFKLTRWHSGAGRRLFLCAPLHHHFEFLEKRRAKAEGRDLEVVETMITIRFWIVSIICALLGVATLKLR